MDTQDSGHQGFRVLPASRTRPQPGSPPSATPSARSGHGDRGRASICGRAGVWLGRVLLVLLTLASLAHLHSELTYDEAVYLRLARTTAESGLPLRRSYEDFGSFHLFANSPPLVLYLASLTQVLAPGDERPARLLHLVVFVVPTYVLVWTLGRRRFGPAAGAASLAVLLGSGSFLQSTPHVLMDVPLGLLALLALLGFERGARVGAWRTRWCALAAVAVALAVWTKYQAVCVVAAIVTYTAWRLAAGGRAAVRRLLPPLSSTVGAAVVAVGLLAGYLLIFGGWDTIQAAFRRNLLRADVSGMSAPTIAAGAAEALGRVEQRLGGALLVFAALAVLLQRRHRRWVSLVTGYVAISIIFNLVLFRLPGSGTHYLDSVVPAVALLAGASAGALASHLRSTAVAGAAVVIVLILQVGGAPPGAYVPPRPRGSAAAAAYIAAHSRPTDGVMATTVAVEFYTGRPVRSISFTYPRDLVLRSLDGTSGDHIAFVLLDAADPPKRMQGIADEWTRLLGEHFEPVPLEAGSITVFKRKASERPTSSGERDADAVAMNEAGRARDSNARSPDALSPARRD
jgi:hypothetical protein